jgi:hypothetical protein
VDAASPAFAILSSTPVEALGRAVRFAACRRLICDTFAAAFGRVPSLGMSLVLASAYLEFTIRCIISSELLTVPCLALEIVRRVFRLKPIASEAGPTNPDARSMVENLGRFSASPIRSDGVPMSNLVTI